MKTLSELKNNRHILTFIQFGYVPNIWFWLYHNYKDFFVNKR
jgi:hypothetical protein